MSLDLLIFQYNLYADISSHTHSSYLNSHVIMLLIYGDIKDYDYPSLMWLL